MAEDKPSSERAPTSRSVVDLEAIAACWLAMDQAGTVDGIERAALSGLRVITDATIAYTARRDDEIWTIGAELGLKGDVAGLVIPEAAIPHAGVLQSGKAICYESGADMGEELKTALAGVGLGSLYAVPIMKAGVCTGALAIGQPGPSLFSSRDRAAVRLCTSHLSSLVAKRESTSVLGNDGRKCSRYCLAHRA